MQCSVGCGGGRGRGQQAQGALEEQVCGNDICMLLMLLCDSVSNAVLLKMVKIVKSAGSKRVNK